MIPPNTGNQRARFRWLLLFILSFSLSDARKTLSLETCATYYCPGDGSQSPGIRFPFIAAGSNSSRRCGYPGFHLTCDKRNQLPILKVGSSGEFSVQQIDYANQMILVTDPGNCLPKRILNLDLAGSPFSGTESINNTFLNCTSGNPSSSFPVMAAPLPCLSGGNFTVFVTFMESAVEELVGSGGCRVMKSVWSPSLLPLYNDGLAPDLDRGAMSLSWDVPDCGDCERRGGFCGFSSGSGLDVGCSVSANSTRALSVQTCPTRYCVDGAQTPPIRFPFVTGSDANHSSLCGYPGFHLTCNKRANQPIISLGGSGNFTVQVIDYANQLIWISDPGKCLPARILSLDLASSPFFGADSRNYTFLNCTGGSSSSPARKAVAVSCLSGGNFTVYVTSRRSTVELLSDSGLCRVIKSVWAPILWPVYRDRSGSDLGTAFMPLGWDSPSCGDCERVGGVCGFNGNSGLDVGCSISIRGASKIVKYGLILGLGIPGFVFMVGLTFYFSGRIRDFNNRRRRHQANTEFSPSIFPQPAVVMVGLEGQVIESYPKTLLGESRRLPNPSDVLCAICLSEYEAKETLRTIPECNHYFHAQCIDEWLRLKGTCPLCRNSPAK